VEDREPLTRSGIDARAARVGSRLARAGDGPDTLVGLALEHSCELLVATPAILKAGAACLPLVPDLPRPRLDAMVRDSGVRLLVTPTALAAACPGPHEHPSLTVLHIDADTSDTDPADGAAWTEARPHPKTLAYVIYTSGSTGRRKGCANTHGALLNRLDWMAAAYGIGPRDRILQKTPIGFDVSVWELLLPALCGATLVMAPPGAHRDPPALRRVIVGHGVTTLHVGAAMPPAFGAPPDLDPCTGRGGAARGALARPRPRARPAGRGRGAAVPPCAGRGAGCGPADRQAGRGADASALLPRGLRAQT
ncbi:AMP-binding protein, partial [Methylobacterium sp. J-068]|uniref:AMP-binding protein n=1 Tax=Methylobacterium sp. J-068 TaxID=2836649 RepID=UPI001FB8B8A6